jgi:uncharacterized protein (DUF302 family)
MRTSSAVAAIAVSAGLLAVSLVSDRSVLADDAAPHVGADGVVKTKSAFGLDETVARLKADVAAKGIVFFQTIDQSKLAADAGIKLSPSKLLIFGNPALGSLFITAKAESGLDWPVRLLVFQDESGQVWTAYTDFAWIARRHGITNRKAEFAMATKVIGSITASVTAK